MSYSESMGNVAEHSAPVGTGPRYRGYQPPRGAIQDSERFRRKDIAQLHGVATDRVGRRIKGAAPISPFDDPTLGFSDELLQLAEGLSEGDRGAEGQDLYDSYAQSPFGVRGTAYLEARQGMARGQREDSDRRGAEIALRNEGQKRADMGFRLGAEGDAFNDEVGAYNDYAKGKYVSDVARFQRKKDRYRAVGEAAGVGADMYMDYMGGGMGG